MYTHTYLLLSFSYSHKGIETCTEVAWLDGAAKIAAEPDTSGIG